MYKIFFTLLAVVSHLMAIPLGGKDGLNIVSVQQDTTFESKNFKIIGLPLIFYGPETKFGGGGAGMITFQMTKDSIPSRPSSVQFGFAYTQLRQVLIYLPFNLWAKNDHYNFFGELGYYRYNYFFWGVGNDQPEENREIYDVVFPRIRMNLLQSIFKNTFTGLKYNFDDFRITRVEEGKLLESGSVTGGLGGIVSSVGWVLKHDSRDNLFSASKGYFAEFSFQMDQKIWGSSFNNSRLILDASTYFTNSFNHTLALNAYLVYGRGTIPFNQMAMLGGGKKMRGYYEGRYRDNNLVMLQSEYRMPLFWRIGVVGFFTLGDVAPAFNQFKINEPKVAYGGGLRWMIDQKQKINLRLDVGWAERKANFYLTVSEAF